MHPPPPSQPPSIHTPVDHGLTATELAAVMRALDEELRDATVCGHALVAGSDDLLLFLRTARSRSTLHVAPGGRRARVTLTSRRFAPAEFDTAPRAHHLGTLLGSNQITTAEAFDGRRCARIRLNGDAPARTLHIELFGARGLWALCDGDERILALSRLPNEAARTLRPGEIFVAAPPLPPREDPPSRFSAPLLANVDIAFTAFDAARRVTERRELLRRGLERAQRRAQDRLRGLEAQASSIAKAPELRARADLLLAYGATVPSGTRELQVPDPNDPTRQITIERDPALPFHEEARRMYDRARRLEAARAIAQGQRDAAEAELVELEQLARRLAATADADTDADLDPLHTELAKRGVVPRPPRVDNRQRERARKLDKITRGENFRRFTSGEGHLILVGRDNAQNDRLSIKVARGNDLWLHVGRGYAGSHVVVRLEKGRPASLETLLDAGTLAIHFSKVRGTDAEEVIYTDARHVRKPKGLPPGKVLAHHHKAIRVRIEDERLKRLLASNPTPSDDDPA